MTAHADVLRLRRARTDPKKACDEWNARHPVGTLCRYWTGGRNDGPGKTARTRTAAQVLSGCGHRAVVWLEGEPGCVCLSHVEAIPFDAEFNGGAA